MMPGEPPPGQRPADVCTMALGVFLLVLANAPQTVSASGFRITNQSLGAVGLSGAHIAYTLGPDASYYNPANMVFQPDQWRAEASLTMLNLPSITYSDKNSPLLNGESDSELFFMPLIHAVSPQYGWLRFGFSLTYPYGLVKQWSQPYPAAFAEKFSLLTVEANPTVACRINDWLSIGGGVSFIYGKGEVNNVFHSADASDNEMGYNLALAIQPTQEWRLATTYRSAVNLDLTGYDAVLGGAGSFSTQLEIPLPAVVSLATSYTMGHATIEIGWDRTFWSSLKKFDFDYTGATPNPIVDAPVNKNWKDTNAYRLGLTYDWDDTWTTTLGFTYDQTPVPDATLGFELPDTDATIYCAGVRYRASKATEVGLSYMYHRTRSRSVSNDQGVDGTFTDGGAHAITVGLITTF